MINSKPNSVIVSSTIDLLAVVIDCSGIRTVVSSACDSKIEPSRWKTSVGKSSLSGEERNYESRRLLVRIYPF